MDTTPTRVICISRALGAGGEAVGGAVSAELGFGYVDEEIVEEAARKVDVPVDLVAGAEARRPLLKRLLGEVAVDVASVSMISGFAPPPEMKSESDDFRQLIQQAIQEIAERGEIVIVAHAASIALAGTPGLLRVLVTGSPDTRADRLAEELELPLPAATKLVRDGDRARAHYFEQFYGLKEELPTHYDLVLNTDVLAPEEAARIVTTACRR
jgi:cytidylate kinase